MNDKDEFKAYLFEMVEYYEREVKKINDPMCVESMHAYSKRCLCAHLLDEYLKLKHLNT